MYGAESGVSGLGRRVVKIVVIQRVSFTKMYKGVQNIQRRIDRRVVVVKLNNGAGDRSNGGHFLGGVSVLGLAQVLCRCNTRQSKSKVVSDLWLGKLKDTTSPRQFAATNSKDLC